MTGHCPAYADNVHRIGPYLHADTGQPVDRCVCGHRPPRLDDPPRPALPDLVQALADAAWSMVVSQQAAPTGWTMSKVGYTRRLEAAVEPFLVRDPDGDVTGFAVPDA